MEYSTLKQANKVKKKINNLLKNRLEIVGIGLAPDGETGYAIKVNLSAELPQNLKLPKKIDGVNLYTRLSGHIKLLSTGENYDS